MLRKLKQRFGGKTIRDVRFRMIFLKLSLVALTCSTVGKSIKRSISLTAQIMPKNFRRFVKGFMFERPEHLFASTRFDFRTVRIALESPLR